MSPARGAALLVTLAAVLALALLWPRASSTPVTAELSAPPHSALHVGHPAPLAPDRHSSLWSAVRHRVTARAAPRADAQPVTRLGTRTPEGTANTLLALGRARDARGRVWVRVRLPILPNGSTGWVPRGAIGGYHRVRTRLIVSLERRRATLLRDGRRILRVAVGVGTATSPTPRGRFYIRNKLSRYRSAFYGPLAFGTSARSAVLTDWPGGGFVGIHGTDRPGLIPGAVSHGCIRMRNTDIVRLGRLMPVGTPLVVS